MLGMAFLPELEVDRLILSQSHVLEAFRQLFPQLLHRFLLDPIFPPTYTLEAYSQMTLPQETKIAHKKQR